MSDANIDAALETLYCALASHYAADDNTASALAATEKHVDALTAQNVILEQTVNELRVQNAELRSRLTPSPLFGANEGRFGEFESAIGKPLQIRRSYDTTTAQVVASIQADQAAGRSAWPSFTSWPSDITSAGQAIANAATRLTLVTYLHEVNNGPKLDAATFRTRVGQLVDAVASNPLVWVVVILTADPYRSQTHEQWFPTGKRVAVGADAYRFLRPPGSQPEPKTGNLGVNRTMGYLLGEENADGSPKAGGGAVTFAQSRGVPLAIGEYAAHPFPTDPTNRPTWLRQTWTYLKNVPCSCLAACYFHSPLGESGSWMGDRMNNFTVDQNDPARLTGAADPQSLAAFAEQLP